MTSIAPHGVKAAGKANAGETALLAAAKATPYLLSAGAGFGTYFAVNNIRDGKGGWLDALTVGSGSINALFAVNDIMHGRGNSLTVLLAGSQLIGALGSLITHKPDGKETRRQSELAPAPFEPTNEVSRPVNPPERPVLFPYQVILPEQRTPPPTINAYMLSAGVSPVPNFYPTPPPHLRTTSTEELELPRK